MIKKTMTVVAVAGISGLLVAGIAASGSNSDQQRFGEITVERINVVDSDGTLRMVIFNQDRAPGIYAHGVEYPHPSRPPAPGIGFYDEEGTEIGGLTVSGAPGEAGAPPRAHGILAFDRFNQDQVVSMQYQQTGDTYSGGLYVVDRPSVPMDYPRLGALAGLEEEALLAEYMALVETGMVSASNRATLIRNSRGDAILALGDGQGRTRLMFRVTEDGTVSAEVLGEDGQVLRDLLAE